MAPLSFEETNVIVRILTEDEGFRRFPYLDCCGRPWKECNCEIKGKLTIGIGRNLDDVGLSDQEIFILQSNDLKKFTAELENQFHWFSELTPARRVVILSMAFNLGIQGLKKFKNMIQAIEAHDFNRASNEMLQSHWASQVKGRGIRLASIMKSGHI